MADVSGAVKAQILAVLDSSPALVALVPAHRIYPMKVGSLPTYPFLRYEAADLEPYDDSCGAGVALTARIHVLAEGEDAAQQISAAVVAALDGATGFHTCDWVRTQVFPEGKEESVFHGVVDFSVIRTY